MYTDPPPMRARPPARSETRARVPVHAHTSPLSCLAKTKTLARPFPPQPGPALPCQALDQALDQEPRAQAQRRRKLARKRKGSPLRETSRPCACVALKLR